MNFIRRRILCDANQVGPLEHELVYAFYPSARQEGIPRSTIL